MSKETVMQAVIEQLAYDLADAEEQIVQYRALAQQALAQSAELMKHNAALRQQVADRRDEIRRYIGQQFEGANAC